MNFEEIDMPTEVKDNNTEPEKPLYYGFVTRQLEEAIGHLQDLLKEAKAEDLSENWFRINMADALTDLNRGYNLRYPENHSYNLKDSGNYVPITVDNARKLPLEIVKELGYTGKSIDEFVYSPPEDKSQKHNT